MSFFRSITRDKSLKFSGIFLSMAMMGQSAAFADFEGPFAPSNWVYAETSPVAHSLTSTEMLLTSADVGEGRNSASYTITLGNYVGSISFDIDYETNDIAGSPFDMAGYVLNGQRVELIPEFPNPGVFEGQVLIDGLTAGTFTIFQESSDSTLGEAVIVISNFRASYFRIPNTLQLEVVGKASQKDSTVSCTPGAYTYLNGGATKETTAIQTLVYTLVIDGKPVARHVGGDASVLAPHLFPAITSSITGTADLNGASWNLNGLKDFSAHCEIFAWQSGAGIQSVTSSVSDSVRVAAQNAKEQAWEAGRSAATAANFTDEARAARKRAANR